MKSSTGLFISIMGLLSTAIITVPANGIVAAAHVLVLPILGSLIVILIGTVVGMVSKKYKPLAYLITAAILIAFVFFTFPFRECGRWWINSETFQKDHPMSKNI